MLIIETTSDSKKKLKNISHILLKGKLAACTQIIKISNSSYIWNDELESKKEYKIIIKTITKNENKIVQTIKKHHNYDVFELSKYVVTNLNEKYEDWVTNCLS